MEPARAAGSTPLFLPRGARSRIGGGRDDSTRCLPQSCFNANVFYTWISIDLAERELIERDKPNPFSFASKVSDFQAVKRMLTTVITGINE